MNAKLLVSIAFLAIAAIACTEGAGAANPSQTDTNEVSPGLATRQPATVTRLVTEWPTPTATTAPLVRPAPTRQPAATVAPQPAATAPRPRATATPRPIATPIRINPNATPTPLWTAVPRLTATPTPTATSTPVPPPTISAAAQGQFRSQLNYQFTMPSGWTEVLTDDSMVLSDPSGKILVTITEQPFDRWRHQSIVTLGVTSLPERPAGWDIWANTYLGAIKNNTAWEYQFTGEKNGERYLNFIQWYSWGDLRVQVSAEVPAFDWSLSPEVRASVGAITGSFQPHDGTSLLAMDDVMAVMYERMDGRPSNIYGRDEALRRRVEFSCRDIYNDLINEPISLGGGVWQISAITLQSVESWWVFEPSGSHMALNSNISRC